MEIKNLSLAFILTAFVFGCNSQPAQKRKQPNEFLEVRVNRWTALEGGETLLLRKINDDWSAMLLGDGERFSCYYQKTAQPKSGYENFWNELQKEGLLEIPDGKIEDAGSFDGSGFVAEVSYQNKLKRFSFSNPKELKSKEAGQISRIGNLISREFDTPVFVPNYDREKVGDYLIDNCKELKK